MSDGKSKLHSGGNDPDNRASRRRRVAKNERDEETAEEACPHCGQRHAQEACPLGYRPSTAPGDEGVDGIHPDEAEEETS